MLNHIRQWLYQRQRRKLLAQRRAALVERKAMLERDLAEMAHWPEYARNGLRNLIADTERRIEGLSE